MKIAVIYFISPVELLTWTMMAVVALVVSCFSFAYGG